MPELPEVEVLRRSLDRTIVGDVVRSVTVFEPRLREPIDRARLEGLVCGGSVIGTRRRAKYLLIDCDTESSIVVHLGMSGRFTLTPGRTPRLPHEHVSIKLESGRRLRFVDPRRFGLLFALETAGIETDRHFAHLGVEPLEEELSGEFLRSVAVGRRGPVKSFLMNARIVVGVGNIYASEALHLAGVHPLRSVSRISAGRWDRVAAAVHSTLEAAIRQGGTTLNDFADAAGQEGYFSVALQVYGREGKDCGRCGAAIRRRVIAGRSTFYCPGCQR